MELKEKRKVRVTESLPILRPTVTGLMETFEAAFRGRNKPVRLLYSKGEDLLIERTVFQEEDLEDPFLTPYQMVRQHADLEIQEVIENALLACCVAVQELRDDNVPLQFIVTSSLEEMKAWIPEGIDFSKLFGVEVFVDADAPEGALFFCGSSVSPMIRDVEKAICCRMV
jgi:hypothetical protein